MRAAQMQSEAQMMPWLQGEHKFLWEKGSAITPIHEKKNFLLVLTSRATLGYAWLATGSTFREKVHTHQSLWPGCPLSCWLHRNYLWHHCGVAQSRVSRNKTSNALPQERLLWLHFKMIPFVSFFTALQLKTSESILFDLILGKKKKSTRLRPHC